MNILQNLTQLQFQRKNNRDLSKMLVRFSGASQRARETFQEDGRTPRRNDANELLLRYCSATPRATTIYLTFSFPAASCARLIALEQTLSRLVPRSSCSQCALSRKADLLGLRYSGKSTKSISFLHKMNEGKGENR